jgi:hypothetical protein
MKKRLLLRLGLATLLGLAGFVAYLWWTLPTSGINRASEWRIRKGMTKQQVEVIVGMPPGDYRPASDELRWLRRRTPIGMGGPGHWTSLWYSDEGILTVDFEGERSTKATYHPATETSFDKLLVWLQLSDPRKEWLFIGP